jgi:hypothetical protein
MSYVQRLRGIPAPTCDLNNRNARSARVGQRPWAVRLDIPSAVLCLLHLYYTDSRSPIGDMEAGMQPTTPNLLLCDQCQVWDGIGSFATWFGYSMSLERISDYVHCLVCRAVAAAVKTIRESKALPAWPTSRIFIRNNGPFFLDLGRL